MMDKSMAVMGFAEFASAVRPSGAVNRVSLAGMDADVFSYSVYMNGPLAKHLPVEAQEYQYKDVMVEAMTEKLGLDSASFRDNLKVAEIVATRGAWMAAVREVAKDRSTELSAQVRDDYSLLADSSRAMEHPWIAAALEEQLAVSMGLGSALAAASKAMGGVVVKDRAPQEVAAGTIVSRNDDFTVQQTAAGEVVTHENRRLLAQAAEGDEVTISYYRGNGQVVASLEKIGVSSPFIDKASLDLAVLVIDEAGHEQKVLFNSMAGFKNFVDAHGLNEKWIPMAMEARASTPKPLATKAGPAVENVSEPYIDEKSGCLAVDFTERGMEHSALFGSAAALATWVQEVRLDNALATALLAKGDTLEAADEAEKLAVTPSASHYDLAVSSHDLAARLMELGVSRSRKPVDGQTIMGVVIAESALHVAQDVGRGEVVVHELCNLSKRVREGEGMTVKYNDGRGQVAEVERGRDEKGR